MRRILTTLLAVAFAGCASTGREAPAAPGAPAGGSTAPLPMAPWASERIAGDAAPAPLLPEWRDADNRATCAPLAPASIEPHTTAVPRAATFGGGWAVAWDLPGQRSAFGVAGTGVVAAEPSYDQWPHHISWADGSTAGYGPEGGTGPRQLAYLRIPGQACLYNVWSNIGREHREQLLNQLRFVPRTRIRVDVLPPAEVLTRLASPDADQRNGAVRVIDAAFRHDQLDVSASLLRIGNFDRYSPAQRQQLLDGVEQIAMGIGPLGAVPVPARTNALSIMRVLAFDTTITAPERREVPERALRIARYGLTPLAKSAALLLLGDLLHLQPPESRQIIAELMRVAGEPVREGSVAPQIGLWALLNERM